MVRMAFERHQSAIRVLLGLMVLASQGAGYPLDAASGDGTDGEDILSVLTVPPSLIGKATFFPVWTQSYDGGSTDLGNDVALDSTGSVYLGGTTWRNGAGEAIVARYSPSGNLEWKWRLHSGNLTNARALSVLHDDSVVIVGITDSWQGEFFAINLASDATERWRIMIPGTGFMVVLDSASDSDGNVIAVGHEGEPGTSGWGGFVFKVSASGELLWRLHVGRPVQGVAVAADDSVIAVGSDLTPSAVDAWRLSAQGTILNHRVVASSTLVGDAARLGNLTVVAADPASFAIDDRLEGSWTVNHRGRAVGSDGQNRALVVGPHVIAGLLVDGRTCWTSPRTLVTEQLHPSMFTYGILPGEEFFKAATMDAGGRMAIGGDRWSGGALGWGGVPGVFGYWDAYVMVAEQPLVATC